MSFLRPSPAPFDLERWKEEPHLARLKPLVQDWGLNGFGSPSFVYFLYENGAVADEWYESVEDAVEWALTGDEARHLTWVEVAT